MLILVTEEQIDHMQNLTMDLVNLILKHVILDKHIYF